MHKLSKRFMNLVCPLHTLVLAASVLVLPSLASAQVPQPIDVTSETFNNHDTLDLKYTAYGDNISPQIGWGELPEGTRQLALIMEDPVASAENPFVHWVAYNIPADAKGIPEGVSTDARVTDEPELEGMINGVNDIRRTGYFGPRPPAGGPMHAYNFWVYALDTEVELEEGLNKETLLAEIRPHIIGAGMIMGHYQREE